MTWHIAFRPKSDRPYPANALQTYIIVSEDKSGESRLRIDDTPRARVIRCFVSPLDAMIEAMCLARSGELFSVMNISAISRDALRSDLGNRLHACVHYAWLGRGGVIPLRPGSEPAACGELIKRWPRGRLIRFELDSGTLKELDRVYEQAGLFAWRDTVRDIAHWDPDKLRDTARFALDTMPTGAHTNADVDQYAVFDPGFRQWHFVPRDA